MAQSSDLERLLQRRRLLIAESDRLRRDVAEGFVNLEAATAWMEKAYAILQGLRSWWPLAAGAAGLFLGTAKGGVLGKVGKIWSLWRLVRRVVSVGGQYLLAAGSAHKPD